jgi:hypothetical protein
MAPQSLPLSDTPPTGEGSMKAHRLELHEGKLSRAVLRGRGGCEAASLPDRAIFLIPTVWAAFPSW